MVLTICIVLVTSVSAFADATALVDGTILDTMTNISFGSRNCTLIYYDSSTPDVTDTNTLGSPYFQKTTYNALIDLYETITVDGVSFVQDAIRVRTYEWYEYGGYCFIRIIGESTAIYLSNYMWAGNANGKILYCDAPEQETTYSVSAIAGASNYYQTNRPAGTTGNGYLGDLQVTYNEWMNIKNELDSISGTRFYYAMGHSINGQYRYYMTPSGMSDTYYVCNSAGQLFYYLKDEGSTEDPGGGGSTFDPTEVITAINSVYDAINSQGSRLSARFTELITSTNSISNTLNMHMNNVVGGFDSLQGQLTTLSSYFSELSGLFPVQETLTLSGSDARVAWDSADRITDVSLSGFGDGDLTVKQYPGALVDESGYEKVTINETEYTLSTEQTGYRTITANNQYPSTGPAIPENSLFYFPFDSTLSSSVGDATLSYNGTVSYADGVDGDAFVFSAQSQSLISDRTFDYITSDNGAFSFAFWLYSPTASSSSVIYNFSCNDHFNYIYVGVRENGQLRYTVTSTGGDLFTHDGSQFPVNSWNHVAFCFDGSKAYCFLNGNLDFVSTAPQNFGISGLLKLGGAPAVGAMIDDCIFVDGTALWTSNFNPYEDAIFSEVAKDYFLACNDQDITLNFHDTSSEQITEYRWNQYTVNTSRLPNGYTELTSIESTGSQYINSGVSASSIGKIEMSIIPRSSTLSLGAVFGANWDVNGYMLTFYQNNLRFQNNGSAVDVNTYIVDDITTIVATPSSLTVNDTSKSISTTSSTTSNSLWLFNCNGTNYGGKFSLLYCRIYDTSNVLVRDFVPCNNPSNAVGLYDFVDGQFYGNSGTGSFIAGNEVSNGSSIGQLVGVVSSTNVNAYPQDGEQDGFYYEYIGSFTEYPSFSQTLTPTDVNGNAITMGRLEDDFSRIYMDISTMIWYCHDPQTQTEILLSSANQEIMNDTIYIRQSYISYAPDQVTANTLQSAFPVDAPVYVDMPENAKVTITYDHYSGWFRMMYLLMDKQTQLLTDLDIVNETIVDIDNTVIEISPDNDAFNIFYIEKTDGSKESVGDAAMDVAKIVGDTLSMFYRLVFEDALSNKGVLNDFEDTMSSTLVGVDVWS